MEFDLVFLFRLLSISGGLVAIFFLYNILILTKGGSKAWKYMTSSGILIGVWGIFQVIFGYFIPITQIRLISGFLVFPIISIFNMIYPIVFLEDMGLKKFKWLTIRNAWYYFFILIVTLSLYNFSIPFNDILAELTSISHTLLPFCFAFSVFGYYFLWKGTRLKMWLCLTLGTILLVIGTGFNLYSACCCNGNFFLICENYHYDYVNTLPLYCSESLISIALKGPVFLIIGVLFYYAGFFFMWKSMR